MGFAKGLYLAEPYGVGVLALRRINVRGRGNGMIEVKDRIPARPNRIKITPEDGGEPFFATWERADEPIQDGTPVNKYLFDSIDEGGFFHTGLDDIEIAAQRVTTEAGWTTVKFSRPLSGVPRVFVMGGDDYIYSVKNITETSCMVAVKQLSPWIRLCKGFDPFSRFPSRLLYHILVVLSCAHRADLCSRGL